MKPFVRIFLFLTVASELVIPVLMFLYVERLYHLLSAGPLASVGLMLAAVFIYIFYAPTIVRVNQRRFPRTNSRALVALLLPLMAETLVFVFLQFQTSVTLPVTALSLTGIHFSIFMLFSATVEHFQTQRVRVFKLSRHFFSPWIVAVIVLFAITNVWVLTGRALTDTVYFNLLDASLSFWFVWAFIWIVSGIAVVLVKYYQSGRTLYAKKGYRPNAAIIVSNGEGQVLLCERSDRPGTIQTVQGGIDPGETPEEAAMREMGEELGIWPDQFEMKAMLLGSKAYEWEEAVKRRLKRTGYVGQQQYFFLAEVPDDVSFDLDYHHREFRKVWWGSPEQLLRLSWSKKRPGIEMALKGFGLLK